MSATIKDVTDVLDLIAKGLAIPTGLLGAYAVYRRWFRPARLGVALDSLVFIAPGGDPSIASDEMLFAVQLRFFNAGEFPESLSDISLMDMTISVNGVPCKCTAYAILKPLTMSEGKPAKKLHDGSIRPAEPSEFKIEASELAHSFFLPGGNQLPLSLLFVPDRNQRFVPSAGTVRVDFVIAAKSATGKTIALPTLTKSRRIDGTEAKKMLTGKTAWLSWHWDADQPSEAL